MRHVSLLIVPIAALLGLVCEAAESPETMRAVRYHTTGPSSVMQLETAPRPVAGPGEVLVRVAAAGINPIDVQLRERSPGKSTGDIPVIPGHDISGRVVAAGAGVDPALVSTDVFALISWRGGAYAEYVSVPAQFVVPKPANLTHAQAAGVPLAALTAYQALFADGHLSKGQSVLIHGGSGGVGHIAIQLAQHAGARVLATASAENLDYIRSLGADVVIDYRSQRFEEVAREVDLVIDSVGGETLRRSYGVIRAGGRLVSLLEQPDPARLADRNAQGARTVVRPDRSNLQHLASLIEKGALQPTISMTYPLADAATAQDDLKRLHKPGKSVLLVQALDATGS